MWHSTPPFRPSCRVLLYLVAPMMRTPRMRPRAGRQRHCSEHCLATKQNSRLACLEHTLTLLKHAPAEVQVDDQPQRSIQPHRVHADAGSRHQVGPPQQSLVLGCHNKMRCPIDVESIRLASGLHNTSAAVRPVVIRYEVYRQRRGSEIKSS